MVDDWLMVDQQWLVIGQRWWVMLVMVNSYWSFINHKSVTNTSDTSNRDIVV